MRTAVLIASTNPAVVQSLGQELRSHNFQVDTADSAESVMVRLQENDPAITLIDEAIDAQPGFRVSSWLKNNGGRSGVIVIGEDETESMLNALDGGADDFVRKSTDIREVMCRVRALLRRYPR